MFFPGGVFSPTFLSTGVLGPGSELGGSVGTFERLERTLEELLRLELGDFGALCVADTGLVLEAL